MASSSAPPEPNREETTSPAENTDAIVLAAPIRDDLVWSSSATSSLAPATAAVEDEDGEATPTPPESSSLSSENGTMTLATTEEESLSVLLSHRTDGKGETGETGQRSEQVWI